MPSLYSGRIYTFDELKAFVYQTICEDYGLIMEGHFTFEEYCRAGNSELGKSEVCGVMFTFNGPRASVYGAIWDIKKNRILFYDVHNRCYRKLHLADIKVAFEEIIN